jgi:hypothetical protein
MCPRMNSGRKSRNRNVYGPTASSVRRRRREPLPCLGATQQRAHTGDSLRFQQERRTGAGSLVGSSAEENDFPVSWNLRAAIGQRFERDPNGSRYEGWFLREPATKIDDKKLLLRG